MKTKKKLFYVFKSIFIIISLNAKLNTQKNLEEYFSSKEEFIPQNKIKKNNHLSYVKPRKIENMNEDTLNNLISYYINGNKVNNLKPNKQKRLTLDEYLDLLSNIILKIKLKIENIKEMKKTYLKIALSLKKNRDSIEYLVEDVNNFIFDYFYLKKVPYCSICRKIQKYKYLLRDDKKLLNSLIIALNKFSSEKHQCYQCYFISSTKNFIKNYWQQIHEIEKLKIKFKKIFKIVSFFIQKYELKETKKKIFYIYNTYKKVISEIQFHNNNLDYLDKYLKLVLHKIPELKSKLKKIEEIPSKEILKKHQMWSTQLKNSFLKIFCSECNAFIVKIHIFNVKKLLKIQENKILDNKNINEDILIPELIEIDNYGKKSPKYLALGNIKGEKIYIKKSKCINCFLIQKTTELIETEIG